VVALYKEVYHFIKANDLYFPCNESYKLGKLGHKSLRGKLAKGAQAKKANPPLTGDLKAAL